MLNVISAHSTLFLISWEHSSLCRQQGVDLRTVLPVVASVAATQYPDVYGGQEGRIDGRHSLHVVG